MESKAHKPSRKRDNKNDPFKDIQEEDYVNEREINNNIDNDSLNDMFVSETNDPANNVRELFDEKTVKAKTDLNARQISKIARAYYLCDILQMPEIKVLLNNFLTLRISKDRKSRAEFVEGLKAKLDNAVATAGGFMRGQFGK